MIPVGQYISLGNIYRLGDDLHQRTQESSGLFFALIETLIVRK